MAGEQAMRIWRRLPLGAFHEHHQVSLPHSLYNHESKNQSYTPPSDTFSPVISINKTVLTWDWRQKSTWCICSSSQEGAAAPRQNPMPWSAHPHWLDPHGFSWTGWKLFAPVATHDPSRGHSVHMFYCTCFVNCWNLSRPIMSETDCVQSCAVCRRLWWGWTNTLLCAQQRIGTRNRMIPITQHKIERHSRMPRSCSRTCSHSGCPGAGCGTWKLVANDLGASQTPTWAKEKGLEQVDDHKLIVGESCT